MISHGPNITLCEASAAWKTDSVEMSITTYMMKTLISISQPYLGVYLQKPMRPMLLCPPALLAIFFPHDPLLLRQQLLLSIIVRFERPQDAAGNTAVAQYFEIQVEEVDVLSTIYGTAETLERDSVERKLLW